jgi:hypothetical protein
MSNQFAELVSPAQPTAIDAGAIGSSDEKYCASWGTVALVIDSSMAGLSLPYISTPSAFRRLTRSIRSRSERIAPPAGLHLSRPIDSRRSAVSSNCAAM